MKNEAREFYLKNKNRFVFKSSAAREIIKQVPITERVAVRWVGDFEKELTE